MIMVICFQKKITYCILSVIKFKKRIMDIYNEIVTAQTITICD